MRKIEDIARELHDLKKELRKSRAINGKKTTELMNLQTEFSDYKKRSCNTCGMFNVTSIRCNSDEVSMNPLSLDDIHTDSFGCNKWEKRT